MYGKRVRATVLQIAFFLASMVGACSSVVYAAPVLGRQEIGIGIDLHGVIVHSDTAEVWRIIKDIVTDCPQKGWLALAIIPIIARFSYLVLTKVATHEMLIDDLIAHFPILAPYRMELIEASTAYIFDAAVVQWLQQMKKEGYILILASNIGLTGLERSRAKYPFFAMFDDFKVPYMVNEPKNLYVAKPQERFFVEWALEVRARYPFIKKIIFIDDQRRNIDSAKKANLMLARDASDIQFEPILFHSAKQVEIEAHRVIIG